MDFTAEMLQRAYLYAANYSDDPNTKNGAIIVDRTRGMMIEGANRLPKRIKVAPELLETKLKYDYLLHAEQDAIFRAYYAIQENSSGDEILFCPYACCSKCAQMIIQAGIKHVVVHKECMDRTPDRWKDSIRVAVEMLEQAGVTYIAYSGKIGGVVSRMNGEDWIP